VKGTALGLVDFYESTGNSTNKNKYSSVASLAEEAVDITNSIISKTQNNIQNISAIKDELLADIANLREKINSIISANQ